MAATLPLLLSLLVAVGLFLTGVQVPWGRPRPRLDEWLRRLERRPSLRLADEPVPEYASPLIAGPLGRLVTGAARRAAALAEAVSLGSPDRLRRRLSLAGQGTILDHYRQKCACALILVLTGLFLVPLLATSLARSGRLPGLPWWLPVVLPAALGLVGFFVPDVLAARALRRRQALARAELPGLLDRLALNLAAGRGLQSGLQQAIRRGGLLAPALTEALTAFRTGGAPIAAGLHRVAEDWELPELHTIASTLNLGDQAGVTVLPALSRLAEDLRAAERDRLVRAGHWAMLRQLVPVALCIFPAFVIILVVPAIDRILAMRPQP